MFCFPFYINLNAYDNLRSQIEHQQKQQEESGIEPSEPHEDNFKLAETGKVLLRSVVDRYLRTVLPKFPEEGIV